MKNLFKKFVLALVMCLSFVACDLLFKTPRKDDNALGQSMLVSYTMQASNWQVDSICKADTLPDMDSWLVNTFVDYETNQRIVRRMYIKERGENEIVYIITGSTEPFVVTRRITE